MIQLGTCSRCKGFLGIAVRACPHCGIALSRARMLLAGITGLAGGGAVSVTLMACYGGPCSVPGSCEGDPDYDGGRTAADARVNPIDAPYDVSTDAHDGAPLDASTDAPLDAPVDAPKDAADAG